ncbi:MAG: hypothetical protein P4L69_19140, partial [Desulfosporosinus sp.]|nr:hypothetical protein [Desulfosporosinus sp.]
PKTPKPQNPKTPKPQNPIPPVLSSVPSNYPRLLYYLKGCIDDDISETLHVRKVIGSRQEGFVALMRRGVGKTVIGIQHERAWHRLWLQFILALERV